MVNSRLYKVKPYDDTYSPDLWAGVLNSSWVMLSSFQYGRPTGNEDLQEQMVSDVALMLVPDPRQSTPKAQQRVAAAFRAMQDRTQLRFLSERDFQETAYYDRGQQARLNELSTASELTQPDRRELDDAVLELLGVARKQEREPLLNELYTYLKQFLIQTRRKEELANANKKKAGSGKRVTPQGLALEIFNELREHHPTLLRRYEELLVFLQPSFGN